MIYMNSHACGKAGFHPFVFYHSAELEFSLQREKKCAEKLEIT